MEPGSPELQSHPIEIARGKIDSALATLNAPDRGVVISGFVADNVPGLDDAALETIRASTLNEIQRRLEHAQQVTQEGGNGGVEVMEENVEQRAARLVRHVERADFESFQEYGLTATKSEAGFAVQTVRMSNRDMPNDLIVGSSAPFSRSPALLSALERMFNSKRGQNELLCLAGERDGKFVIQGSGQLHLDRGARANPSCFTVAFNDQSSQQDFIRWLEESPNEALKQVMERVMSVDGNPARTEFPGGGRKFDGERGAARNPFDSPIKAVRVKDIGRIEAPIIPASSSPKAT